MANQIPVPLISVIAEEFSKNYTHTEIDSRFFAAGFSPEPPPGNKQDKCHIWLIQANKLAANPLMMVGRLLEEIMEVVPAPNWSVGDHPVEARRQRIHAQLAIHGLSYQPGGHILHLGATITTRTLEQIVHERDLTGVHREFERIFANLEADPGATLTASCALLEALFKTYIADEALNLPADQSVLPLWKVVRSHLRLDPGELDDEGLKKILSGLASIVDGTASLRTRRGSAHGHDGRSSVYRIEPRHARLTANAAMALATFFIEVVRAKTHS